MAGPRTGDLQTPEVLKMCIPEIGLSGHNFSLWICPFSCLLARSGPEMGKVFPALFGWQKQARDTPSRAPLNSLPPGSLGGIIPLGQQFVKKIFPQFFGLKKDYLP